MCLWLAGFTRSEMIRVEAEKLWIGLLRSGAVVLEFFAYGGTQPLPDYRRTLSSDLRTIGTKHAAFAVTDIVGFHERLAAAGVTLATDLRVFGGGQRYFCVADPDGILLEIEAAARADPGRAGTFQADGDRRFRRSAC